MTEQVKDRPCRHYFIPHCAWVPRENNNVTEKNNNYIDTVVVDYPSLKKLYAFAKLSAGRTLLEQLCFEYSAPLATSWSRSAMAEIVHTVIYI